MKVKAFKTSGNCDIEEWEYDKPEPTKNQIEVKSVMTGICSSDIAMYNDRFQLLPKEIQGHEGIGIVTKIGSGIMSIIKEGDYVATRGEPAFAEYYNANESTFVDIPELSPKYIIEPVACGINIAESMMGAVDFRESEQHTLLILGSGWIAMIVHQYIRTYETFNHYVVVGDANIGYWDGQTDVTRLYSDSITSGKQFAKYSAIIDLTDKPEYVGAKIYEPEAVIAFAAEKSHLINISLDDYLWNAVTIVFPSPRRKRFHDCMSIAKYYIKNGYIKTENMWSHRYTCAQIKQGFEEGSNRPNGYKRGYIEWEY